MRDSVLLVGEDFGNSPQRYHNDAGALTGASGRRLCELAGYQGPNAMFLFMLDFARTNVVELAPQWGDREAVADGVTRILQMTWPRNLDDPRRDARRVVLLGRRVAKAFGMEDEPLMTWSERVTLRDDLTSAMRVAVMPHPSGRNRFWNDPASVEAARRFMFALRQSI